MVKLSLDIDKRYTAEFSFVYRTGRKSLSDRLTELLRYDTRGAKEEVRDRDVALPGEREAPKQKAAVKRSAPKAIPLDPHEEDLKEFNG